MKGPIGGYTKDNVLILRKQDEDVALIIFECMTCTE